MSYIKTGQEAIRQREYEEGVRFRSDVDSYTEQTPLAFSDTRALIKDPHDTRELALIIHSVSEISLSATDVIELTVLLHRIFDNLPAEDITEDADWTTSAGGVATVDNGQVTAVGAGSAEIQATFEGMESNIITITVT